MELTMDGQTLAREQAPWHLWAVGGLTLVWNLFCVARYMGAQFGLVETGAMAETELALFAGLPLWIAAFWALSVWGALAGSALLLVRSKWAVQSFVMAVIGLMATSAYLFAFAGISANLYAMPVALAAWIITLLSLFYASRVHSAGLLK